MRTDRWNHRPRNVRHGVRDARILRFRAVIIIRYTRHRIENHVLQHRSETNRVPNLRLALSGKLDALGVTAAFDVEYALIRPTVLVVTDQRAIGIGRKRRLTSP